MYPTVGPETCSSHEYMCVCNRGQVLFTIAWNNWWPLFWSNVSFACGACKSEQSREQVFQSASEMQGEKCENLIKSLKIAWTLCLGISGSERIYRNAISHKVVMDSLESCFQKQHNDMNALGNLQKTALLLLNFTAKRFRGWLQVTSGYPTQLWIVKYWKNKIAWLLKLKINRHYSLFT